MPFPQFITRWKNLTSLLQESDLVLAGGTPDNPAQSQTVTTHTPRRRDAACTGMRDACLHEEQACYVAMVCTRGGGTGVPGGTPREQPGASAPGKSFNLTRKSRRDERNFRAKRAGPRVVFPTFEKPPLPVSHPWQRAADHSYEQMYSAMPAATTSSKWLLPGTRKKVPAATSRHAVSPASLMRQAPAIISIFSGTPVLNLNSPG